MSDTAKSPAIVRERAFTYEVRQPIKRPMIPHNRTTLEKDDFAALHRVLKSGWVAEGSVSRQLERTLAQRLKQKHAKVTSSGTSALHLALLALEIKPGDEVIVSTYVCTALLNAILYIRAEPVLVDIDPVDLGPSWKAVERSITRKTRAIIVNHSYGFPAQVQKIKSFGIPVIEDCAQALGSQIMDEPLGSFGDLSVCSFYATKMMTTGYGGMVLTRHSKYAQKILDLTHFDQRRDYKVRYNYSLSDLSSALGLSQVTKLDSWIKKRRATALRYIKALQGTDLFFWTGREQESPNFYRFVAGNLQPFQNHVKKMNRLGIQVISPLEPYQLLHRYLGLNLKSFPAAEAASRSLISLPIYPSLKENEIKRICKVLGSLL